MPIACPELLLGKNMKILFCGVVSAFLAVSALADVAYSSFGSGDSYDAAALGFDIGGGDSQRVAVQFTSATTGVLDSVEFATRTITSGDINVLLFTDNFDEVGSQMLAWGETLTAGPSVISKLTNPFPSVVLTAGSKYWLELRPVTGGMWAVWNENNQGLASWAFAETSQGSGYATINAPAFRVTTGVVPEPASLAALGLGALALVRKRRKSA